MAITALGLLLVVVIGAAVLAPFVYVVVTWDHDIARTLLALPAPNDFGTKEFAWRCSLSSLTRVGWRSATLRSPCPRVTLQCPFALLSSDFAQLATSLGCHTLALEQLPFVFPQVATSSLLLQLLGNSHFPVSVRALQLKALTITQLRPLDMRFREPLTPSADDSDASDADATDALLQQQQQQQQGIQCVMVLTEKRFLEHAIEFVVQTDLFDDQGTLWQSVAWLTVPFTQQTLLVPLAQSGFRLDPALLDAASDAPLRASITCTARNLTEFSAVATPSVTGANVRDKTPVLWLLGQVASVLQREHRVPALPLMCSVQFADDAAAVPLGATLTVESRTIAAAAAAATLPPASASATSPSSVLTSSPVQFAVTSDQTNVLRGLLRTVGWTFPTADASTANEE